jgi:acyl-CoA thioester hydrolase
MNAYISEQRISELPVVVRRRVKWGECDPAGVVYTPVFSEYVISAFQIFMDSVLGSPMQKVLAELDLNTPLRALSFDFKRSFYPDQLFDMTVYMGEMRNTTFVGEIRFSDEVGREVTAASLTAICVHYAGRKSRAIPERVRELFEAYRSRCPLPVAVRAEARAAA